jgi:hypothetical protein
MSAERDLWRLIEPVHDVTYHGEPARAAFVEAGLRGFWRGYFAGRAAPLGPVGAPVVLASFFSFAPAMVNRALPDVWTRASPDRVLTARVDGAVATLTALLPDPGTPEVAAAAELLEAAAASLEPAGRVLGAANAALPPNEHPLARLWQAATTMREHRGDGHNAALVAAGIGPVEALALRCGIDLDRQLLQQARGWTDEEWTDAQERLAERGLLNGSSRATTDGLDLMRAVEDATDLAASAPLRSLGAVAVTRLAGLLNPIATACHTILPAGDLVGLNTR